MSGINLKEVVNEEMQCEICRKENKMTKIDEKRIARLQIAIGCRGDRSLNSCENPN